MPAFSACSAANSQHVEPLAAPSCTPPALESKTLTTSSVGRGRGFLEVKVFYCPPCASAVNENVFLSLDVTDVRLQSDDSDYTGELQAGVDVRITDHLNSKDGSTFTDAGTMVDYALEFVASCTATPDIAVGGHCVANTSLLSLLPGAVREGGRAVWELHRVVVRDGGSDGLSSTPEGNAPFLEQGAFTP